jgi:hypothetical protein
MYQLHIRRRQQLLADHKARTTPKELPEQNVGYRRSEPHKRLPCNAGYAWMSSPLESALPIFRFTKSTHYNPSFTLIPISSSDGPDMSSEAIAFRANYT